MQIKSWQIALLSLVYPLIVLLQAISCTKQFSCKQDGELFLAGIYLSIIAISILVPVVFLILNKTKKVGAYLSIIFGVLATVAVILIDTLGQIDNPGGPDSFTIIFQSSPSIFILIAGIYYFKVESKTQS